MDTETLHSVIDSLDPSVVNVDLVDEDTMTAFKISEVYVNHNTLSLVFNTRNSRGKAGK